MEIDAVRLVKAIEYVPYVQRESGGWRVGKYRVTKSSVGPVCQCSDSVFRRVVCKHGYAVILHEGLS